MVTAEHSEQSFVGLLHRRLICTIARYHSSIVGTLFPFFLLSFLPQSCGPKIK